MLRPSRTMAGLPCRNRELPGDGATWTHHETRESGGERSSSHPVCCHPVCCTSTERIQQRRTPVGQGVGEYSFEMSTPEIQDTGSHAWIWEQADRQLWSPFHTSQFGSPVFHYFVSPYCVQSSIFSCGKTFITYNLPFNHLKTMFTSVATFTSVYNAHPIHRHNFFFPSQTGTLAVKSSFLFPFPKLLATSIILSVPEFDCSGYCVPVVVLESLGYISEQPG